ncbi:hypothetical protein E2C01_102780 [Portunus trituberculatus]|uniref:Uncharacterized protein n=1 Tax=Portunus trituberculatus TaxID=210409 RepID=A0A5B7K933_PORTR|nr:hypothetical protein [Portunus trituberculatus]
MKTERRRRERTRGEVGGAVLVLHQVITWRINERVSVKKGVAAEVVVVVGLSARRHLDSCNHTEDLVFSSAALSVACHVACLLCF